MPGKSVQKISDPFVRETFKALNSLYDNSVGGINYPGDNGLRKGNVLTDFVDGQFSDILVTIGSSDPETGTRSFGDPSLVDNPHIEFDTRLGIIIPNYKKQSKGALSPRSLLLHEFAHVWLWTAEPNKTARAHKAYFPEGLKPFGNDPEEEDVLKFVERPSTSRLGEGIRLYYQDGFKDNLFFRTSGPTKNK